MNADRAAKYRVSIVATLANTNTELSDVSSDDVLIDALHETPGVRLLAIPAYLCQSAHTQ